MNKSLSALALAALLCGASVPSQAATMTLTQWTFGNGNVVSASAPAFGGYAGGFSGTLSGAGEAFDGNIDSYCVELTQTFNWNTAYGNSNLVSSSSYFADSAKADTLGKLLSYANPLVESAAAGSQDDFSTSLQLAIWNTVYDNDNTLSDGAFKDSSAFAAKADEFLAGARGQASSLELWVLASANHQDQLIWLEPAPRLTGQDVPEPTSLMLAIAAFGGLGLASRRRRSRTD